MRNQYKTAEGITKGIYQQTDYKTDLLYYNHFEDSQFMNENEKKKINMDCSSYFVQCSQSAYENNLNKTFENKDIWSKVQRNFWLNHIQLQKKLPKKTKKR